MTLGWAVSGVGILLAAAAGFVDCAYSFTKEGHLGAFNLRTILFTAVFAGGIGLFILGRRICGAETDW
jgi:hypothetical protein